jgi:hypothetical protein
MTAGRGRRSQSLADFFNPWKTPEGRLVAVVAVLGLAAAAAALAFPWLYSPLRTIAIACAILVAAIPVAAFALHRDDTDDSA